LEELAGLALGAPVPSLAIAAAEADLGIGALATLVGYRISLALETVEGRLTGTAVASLAVRWHRARSAFRWFHAGAC